MQCAPWTIMAAFDCQWTWFVLMILVWSKASHGNISKCSLSQSNCESLCVRYINRLYRSLSLSPPPLQSSGFTQRVSHTSSPFLHNIFLSNNNASIATHTTASHRLSLLQMVVTQPPFDRYLKPVCYPSNVCWQHFIPVPHQFYLLYLSYSLSRCYLRSTGTLSSMTWEITLIRQPDHLPSAQCYMFSVQSSLFFCKCPHPNPRCQQYWTQITPRIANFWPSGTTTCQNSRLFYIPSIHYWYPVGPKFFYHPCDCTHWYPTSAGGLQGVKAVFLFHAIATDLSPTRIVTTQFDLTKAVADIMNGTIGVNLIREFSA